MQTNRERNAYRQGKVACFKHLRSATPKANPYSYDHDFPLHNAWSRGWATTIARAKMVTRILSKGI